MSVGTRKWIRGINYCYASAARPGIPTISTAEIRRRLYLAWIVIPEWRRSP